MPMFGIRLPTLDDESERGPFLPSSGYEFLLNGWLLREHLTSLFGRRFIAEEGHIANESRSRSSRRRGRHLSSSSSDYLQRTLLAIVTFSNHLVGS